ncbi:MAG: nuclear transport factor 2 family protein [Saprospiraceae bacterium]|nr:nuclear transport factor 2 family protein [Saprospiraceae bacterium]
MKTFALSLLLVLSMWTAAGAQAESPQQTIDRQVWRPFMDSYARLDTEAFMELHTDDVVRIVRDGERILTDSAYAQSVSRNHDWARQNKVRRSIEFSFTERFADGDYAFETGYYKITTTRSGTEPRVFYGQFHVLLRRDDGRWKIAVDTDTSHDGSVGQEAFDSGDKL